MIDVTTTDTNDSTNIKHLTMSLPSTSFRCTTCQATYEDTQAQRIHMKEPWHVYNIKRRIASLPPISLYAFQSKVNIKQTNSESERDSSESEEEDAQSTDDEETASPYACLFCSQGFIGDDAGFESNLEHMRTSHGLHIPESQLVQDTQSLIGYLATEVRVWHECLYCGATKPSTQAVQGHMRDKGHCQINLDREPELRDFWGRSEPSDEDDKGTVKQHDLSDTEMRFASGKVVASRRAGPSKKTRRPCNTLALTNTPSSQLAEDGETSLPTPASQTSSGRQLARREETGLVGVLPQQRQALVLAEQKARRSEQQAIKTREWIQARGANSREFDQLNNQMKWGKQNHKLLPR